MPTTRKHTRRHRKQRGCGYQTSQQFFNPATLPPTTFFPAAVSTASTAGAIRPVLASTFQTGGKTRSSLKRGGFAPSVMGSFIANAQAAIVPLALYTIYHTTVPKRGATRKGGKSRKQQRK
jgi:hypothetical protein